MIRLDPAVSTRIPAERREGPPVLRGDRWNAMDRAPREEAREIVEVLVVDDDALVRTLLSDILDREDGIRVVGVATDALSALDLAVQLTPHVVVLDADLPRAASAEVVDRLPELALRSKVLLLMQNVDEEFVLEALRRGAHGYVPKHAAVALIARAVRAVAAGEACVERRLMGRLLSELSQLTRHVEPTRGPGATLSLRERQIVQLIAAGKTNHEIAGTLFLSPHTVKSHVSHILQKLALPNRTEVAIFAVKAGWVNRAA
jgi:DNA-binding NarL/FixJ family response regulator